MSHRHHHHHHKWLSLSAATQLVIVLAVASAAQMLPEPSPVMLEAAGEVGGRHGDSVSKVAKPSYVLAVDGDVYVEDSNNSIHVSARPSCSDETQTLHESMACWPHFTFVSLFRFGHIRSHNFGHHRPSRRYVSEFWENRVVRIRGASAATVFAAGGGLDGPWGLAAIDDVLLVASFATDRIHR